MSALLELFELDVSNVIANTFFYFTNEVAEGQSSLVFDGNTYEAHPVTAMGYEKKGDGLASPQLTVGDPDGFYSRTIDALDGLAGCKVTRRQIRYDDLADPDMQRRPDVFFVSHPMAGNGAVTLNLRSVLSSGTQKFPRRIVASLF